MPRSRLVLYALLTSLTAFSIDAMLPGLHLIEAALTPSPPLSTPHVVSLFIFGMGFGEFCFGPLADAIGRRRAVMVGLGCFVAGAVMALSASSMAGLILGRMLQGFGVAGPKIGIRAIIRDQVAGEDMARILSFMFTLLILVPMIAPSLGQAVMVAAGWRSLFGFYLVAAVVLGFWFLRLQPETLPPERRIPLRPGLLVRNSLRILSNRRVSLLIAATGFAYGAQLVYLSTAAEFFFDVYGIRDSFPVYFAGLASAVGLASYANARFVQRFGMETMARHAVVGLSLAGLLLLADALVWHGRPPLPFFLAPAFAAFFAIGVLYGNFNAMAMRSLGQVAGIGASLIASLSSFIASLFSVALAACYDGTVSVLAVGFFLGGLVSLVLIELALRGSVAAVEAVR